MNNRLADAIRIKYGSPQAALRALGLDVSLLEDRKMTNDRSYNRDRGYRGYRSARDEEEERRDHQNEVRDALRRCADAADIDEEEISRAIEVLADFAPEVVAQAAREISGDGSGPRKWARDRRDLRRAEDAVRLRRARDTGRRPSIVRDYGPPGVGRENESPAIERFPGNRAWEEGVDRARHAADMAYDGGGQSLTEFILGRQGMAITRGVR
jgi:hypothetical protein